MNSCTTMRAQGRGKRRVPGGYYLFVPLLLLAAVAPAGAFGDEETSDTAAVPIVVEEARENEVAVKPTEAEEGGAVVSDTEVPETEKSKDGGEDPEGEVAPKAPRWIRGTFEVEGDAVVSDSDRDLDFSQYLRFSADPPKYPRLHVRGSLWLHQDVSADSGKANTLRDINDASSSDVQARLLYLYADIDDALGDQSVLRIGRQRIQDGPTYNRIDGLYLKKRVNKVEGYAFLGARASVYRDTSDDLVLGGGLAFIPAPQTRIAIDGYYAEESRYGVSKTRPSLFLRRYSRPIAPEINDSRVTLSLWHNFGANTRVHARIGMRGSDLDELILSLNGYIPRLDLLYDIDYRQLFDSTGDTTSDLSRFYRVLGQYREHQTLYVGLHRPITKRITLSLEGEIRNAENDDFYSGNRDYTRVATVLSVKDIAKGFDVAASVEYWDVSGGEGTWTMTGEISRTWKNLEWRAGVDYVRYKDRVVEYDQNAAFLDAVVVALVPGLYPGFSYLTQYSATRVVDTRENVYSIFTDLEWTFRKDQAVFAKISYEEDDGPDSPYWRIRAGYRVRF